MATFPLVPRFGHIEQIYIVLILVLDGQIQLVGDRQLVGGIHNRMQLEPEPALTRVLGTAIGMIARIALYAPLSTVYDLYWGKLKIKRLFRSGSIA